ncbi:MAG: ABC transporter permease, partial [Alphaproteobacteria bacterium]
SRAAEWARLLMLMPNIVPSLVYAVGLYRYYAELHLLGSYLGVILAHAVMGLPYVIIAVSASLANFDRRVEQAAKSLGASGWQTIRLVIVPNILPGLLSGAIFAFVHSWDELVVVLFIASRAIHTIPRLMWDGINENLDPKIAVVAAAMILFTVTLLLAAQPLRRARAAAST